MWVPFGPLLPVALGVAAPVAATTGDLVVAWRESLVDVTNVRVARLAADLSGWTDLALPPVPGAAERIVRGPRLVLDDDVAVVAFSVHHLAKDPVDGSSIVESFVVRRNE